MPPKSLSKSSGKWKPAPPELIDTFHLALLSFSQAEIRKTFGYPAGYANGYMFTGLFQENMILKLPEEDVAKFLKIKGAKQFEPMPGRPMKGFVVVPETMLKSKAKLRPWLDKALEYAKAQPQKAKRKK